MSSFQYVYPLCSCLIALAIISSTMLKRNVERAYSCFMLLKNLFSLFVMPFLYGQISLFLEYVFSEVSNACSQYLQISLQSCWSCELSISQTCARVKIPLLLFTWQLYFLRVFFFVCLRGLLDSHLVYVQLSIWKKYQGESYEISGGPVMLRSFLFHTIVRQVTFRRSLIINLTASSQQEEIEFLGSNVGCGRILK